MKLWQKISLVCIAILAVTVTVTSLFLFYFSRNNILELTVANAKEKQSGLCKTFVRMMEQVEDSPAFSGMSERETILYCFSTLADESSVLVSGDETLYSYVSVKPEEILPLSTGDQRVFLDEVGARNLLIVGSLVAAANQVAPFAVYEIKDISAVYEAFDNLMLQYTAIAASFLLLGMLLIAGLVHKASGPLKSLSHSARRIADGQYAERADVRTRDEVGMLAGDFNRMAAAVQENFNALQEKNERQEAFIHGLTHEFKTPMTSMMLHSETLLNANLPEDARNRSLMHIRTQCAWLERLTQKLMKLVTLNEDVHLSESSVSGLFASVRESVTESLAKRGHALITDCKVDTLPMDTDLMHSLLVNLVENASKASEPGETVTLSAEGRTVTVTDHGRGIPADAIDKVTEPFYTVDKSRSKAQGGSGLGLALVKRIADAHHAQLRIESKPGEGTSISVVFPPAEENPAPSPAAL